MTFKPDDWSMEDALIVALIFALRKQTAHVARNSQALAEKLGEALAENERLESALEEAKNAAALHLLVRRKENADFFYARPENIREFQVKPIGASLYEVTLDDQVGEGDTMADLRLLTTHAQGDGNIFEAPDTFTFADPVRRLFWARDDGKWKPTPLKSELTGEGAQLHDLFVKTGWEPADIVGPYPFDPSLKIEVLADDTWQIHDKSGGIVVERDGKLVYKKGDRTILCQRKCEPT